MNYKAFISSLTDKLFLSLSAVGIIFSIAAWPGYSIIFGGEAIRHGAELGIMLLAVSAAKAVSDCSDGFSLRSAASPALVAAAVIVPAVSTLEGRGITTDGYLFCLCLAACLPFAVFGKNRVKSFIYIIVWGLTAIVFAVFGIRGFLDFRIWTRVFALPLMLLSSAGAAHSESKAGFLPFAVSAALSVFLIIDVFAL